jgi:hypothetical protein
MPESWESKKEKLFERDKARCQCCSKKLTLYSMTFGHRVSRAISQTDQLPNLQLECASCNNDKSKLNIQYIRNARSFIKNGGKLEVNIHPVTYNRLEKAGDLEWFENHNYILIQNEDIMVGDFAVL